MPTLSPPSPLNEEMVHSMGLLIAWWAPMEYLFDKMIAAALNISPYESIVLTLKMPWQTKRDTLSSLITTNERLTKEQINKIRSYISKADKLSSIRSNVAHKVWKKDPNREGAFIPYILKVGDKKIRAVGIGIDQLDKELSKTPEEILNHAIEIYQLGKEIREFLETEGLDPFIDK